MTRTNRFANRALLLVLGLLLIGVAAYVANRAYPVVALPAIPSPTVTALWVTAAAALVLVVLAIAVALSRGRGQTRTVVRQADDAGVSSIQSRVVSDLVADDLARVPDIVGVSASAFTVRGRTALELRVTTRGSADLRVVVDSVERAVVELDAVLETRIPVLLHVASGVRAGLAREQRVR